MKWWHDVDKLGIKKPVRPEKMEQGRQPLTFNIEQQDSTTWWQLFIGITVEAFVLILFSSNDIKTILNASLERVCDKHV